MLIKCNFRIFKTMLLKYITIKIKKNEREYNYLRNYLPLFIQTIFQIVT